MDNYDRDELISRAIDVVTAEGLRITDAAHIAALNSVYELFVGMVNIDMLNDEYRTQLEMVKELIYEPNHAA